MGRQQTTVTVYPDTKAEFDRVQPSGLTNDEFVQQLLGLWKQQ